MLACYLTVFEKLLTEQPNPASASIDTVSTEQMLEIINAEDAAVPDAVAREIPQIARAVDAIVKTFEGGGRLFYLGAGTSGRLRSCDSNRVIGFPWCSRRLGVERENGTIVIRRQIAFKAATSPSCGCRAR